MPRKIKLGEWINELKDKADFKTGVRVRLFVGQGEPAFPVSYYFDDEGSFCIDITPKKGEDW